MSERSILKSALPGTAGTSRQLAVHLLLIFGLSLLLLIPKLFFDLLLSERIYMQDSAVHSVVQSWGSEQHLTAPLLLLNAQQLYYESDGLRGQKSAALYLPAKNLSAKVSLSGEERRRGIYTATLYRAEIEYRGSFSLENLQRDLSESNLNLLSIDTHAPFIYFLLSHASGIEEVSELTVNGKAIEPRSAQHQDSSADAFMAALPPGSAENGRIDFTCRFILRGALTLSFTAFADNFALQIAGQNLSPGFQGNFLPGERTVTEEGFDAHYKISSLAAGYGSIYLTPPENADIVIDLQKHSDHYTFVDRMSKYALLIIAMTFLTVLLFELVSGILVSLVQYAVTGAGLIVFYLLLLSLSEHISFICSYTAAALCLSVMLALYMKGVFGSWKKGGMMFLVMIALYLLLFAIANAENYALLMGSVLLTVMLGMVMFLTRRLNQERNEQ